MSSRASKPTRKDTDDTLVGSPMTLVRKSSWFSTLKKRTMSYDGSKKAHSAKEAAPIPSLPGSQNRGAKGASKRKDTADTLVDSLDGEHVLGDEANSILDKDDSVPVWSPVSSTSPSTIFSPMTPSTFSITSSPSLSPDATRSRKRVWPFSKKAERSVVSALESTRSTALLIARTTLSIAEASNLPYLKGVVGIVSLILEYADGVSGNKENCLRIINNVMRLLNALDMKLKDLGGKPSPKLEHQVDQLKSSLNKISLYMKQLSDRSRSYMLKFMLQESDKEVIKKCEIEMEQAFKIFSLQSFLDVHTSLSNVETQISQGYTEILEQLGRQEALLETIRLAKAGITQAEISESNDKEEHVSYDSVLPERTKRSASWSERDKAALCSASLPPSPKIFHGRGEVLTGLVGVVTRSTATRVAILGPGGIGKSTLALKMLHHEDVIKQYDQRRFFVSCDSATSAEGLISVIASHFGLTDNQRHCDARRGEREADILAWLTGAAHGAPAAVSDSQSRALVVLDNFESPWERLAGRTDVEAVLGRIAELNSVTLVITLRGTERPGGVEWDRPFLRPLSTLDAQAARSLFLSISDADYRANYIEGARDDLDELLDLCGHLPLAVELMARLAQPEIESVPSLLRRWKRAATSILNQGQDRSHSLEVSIELSLKSPRLAEAPDACALLSVLALLPDGLRSDQLACAAPHVQNVDVCSLTLLRTSLAYLDGCERLRVLAPIRAYVANADARKAPQSYVRLLQKYFWDILKRAGNDGQGGNSEEGVRSALPELGNIGNLIERAFSENVDLRDAIVAAVGLAEFHQYVELGRPRSLEKALELSRLMQNKKLEADCLYALAHCNRQYVHDKRDRSVNTSTFRKALALYEDLGDKAGQGKCFQQLGAIYHALRKFYECRSSVTKALEMYREAGSLYGQASALLYLARISQDLNQSLEAKEHANAALQILRTELHSPVLEAQCLDFLGGMHCTVFCDYASADELLGESLRIYKALLLEESTNCMNTKVSMGELAFICSKFGEAKDAFGEAAAIYSRLKRRDREAYALIYLGRACLGLGDIKGAAAHINAGLGFWQEIRNNWGVGISTRALGDVAVQEGVYARAEECYAEALDTLRRDSAGARWTCDEAECLLKLGVLFMHTEQKERALEGLRDALALHQKAACRRGETDCLRYLGELDLMSGDDGLKKSAILQISSAKEAYGCMGLHKESQECTLLIAGAYRANGGKMPNRFRKQALQLQIGI